MAQHQASIGFYCKSKEKNFPHGAAFSRKTSSKEIKSGAYKIPLDLLPEKDRLSGVKKRSFHI